MELEAAMQTARRRGVTNSLIRLPTLGTIVMTSMARYTQGCNSGMTSWGKPSTTGFKARSTGGHACPVTVTMTKNPWSGNSHASQH